MCGDTESSKKCGKNRGVGGVVDFQKTVSKPGRVTPHAESKINPDFKALAPPRFTPHQTQDSKSLEKNSLRRRENGEKKTLRFFTLIPGFSGGAVPGTLLKRGAVAPPRAKRYVFFFRWILFKRFLYKTTGLIIVYAKTFLRTKFCPKSKSALLI